MGKTDPEPAGWAFMRLRIERGMSARELADAAGVSHGCVTRVEGGVPATRVVLAKLARVLGSVVYDVVRPWPPPPEGDQPLIVARRALDMTRRQAARRIGVSEGVLGRAERGQPVHPRNAKVIADAYGLPVADVLSLPPRARNTGE